MGFWAALGGAALQLAPSVMSSLDAHKARDMQKNYIQIRAGDAKRAGIHPLAAIGAPGFNAPAQGDYSSMAQLGQQIMDRATRKKNLELLDAQINNINADTKNKNGLSSQKGLYTTPSPNPVTPAKTKGIAGGVNPSLKYVQNPDGYFDLVPLDNEMYSDEAPITTQALFLYDEIARRTFGVKLYNNFMDPELQIEKQEWLNSKPPAQHGGIVLWDIKTGRWREVSKKDKRHRGIFFTGDWIPNIKNYPKKKRRLDYVPFSHSGTEYNAP